MSIVYKQRIADLTQNPKIWLITGVAGFIGSNLLEHLLELNQIVIGMDNFSTGYRSNLEEVKISVTAEKWSNYTFIYGDICSLDDCHEACKGVDYVLHQAALGSVPRSVKDPLATNDANINGFLNMLIAARDAEVRSFTYAASSSTYGDSSKLPKNEDSIGAPLSPYAVTKLVNELYADVFAKTYAFNSIGLRYFNVFGKRQSSSGAYAAVIPKWISAMLSNEDVSINGDGTTSRDFCFIENAVQANILAATSELSSRNEVYNVAVGDRTELTALYSILKGALIENGRDITGSVVHLGFRKGDVLHSQASIAKATEKLGYIPEYDVYAGINKAIHWYIDKESPHP
ncbi:NAD-dependent epimerase/dehydratase family protein [Pseudomonadales bacterium]|nr:NAD-dependent epimerase/dehydratase family protein [Pseudomonadales bacterium]